MLCNPATDQRKYKSPKSKCSMNAFLGGLAQTLENMQTADI